LSPVDPLGTKPTLVLKSEEELVDDINDTFLTFNHEYMKRGFKFYGFSDMDELSVLLYQYFSSDSSQNPDYDYWIMQMEYRCDLQYNLDQIQPQLELFASYFSNYITMSKLELGCIV